MEYEDTKETEESRRLRCKRIICSMDRPPLIKESKGTEWKILAGLAMSTIINSLQYNHYLSKSYNILHFLSEKQYLFILFFSDICTQYKANALINYESYR